MTRPPSQTGQSLELTPHLIPPPIQIGRNHSWLLFIWYLDRREGLSPPTTVLKLAATRCTQVSDPVRLPTWRYEIALAIQLKDIDRHTTPVPRVAATHVKSGHSPQAYQERVSYSANQPARLKIARLRHSLLLSGCARFT